MRERSLTIFLVLSVIFTSGILLTIDLYSIYRVKLMSSAKNVHKKTVLK